VGGPVNQRSACSWADRCRTSIGPICQSQSHPFFGDGVGAGKVLGSSGGDGIGRAIIEALGSYAQSQVLVEMQNIYPSEASYFAEAEAIRALGRMRDPSLLGLFKELVQRESWNDVLRSAALDAIAALKLPESISLLKTYSQRGHSPNARMTAIRGLGSLAMGREDIQQHLIRLLSDPYLLVQIAVVRTLGQVADERAVKALMKYTSGDLDGRLKRTAEESIRKIRKGMEQEFPSKK
jgi:HEAT repeat protein